MKPNHRKNHRPARKTRKRAQRRAAKSKIKPKATAIQAPGELTSQPRPLDQVCRELGLDSRTLDELYAFTIRLTSGVSHSDAHDVAIDAFLKALVSFKDDPTRDRLHHLRCWIRFLVKCSSKNLSARYRTHLVVDAFRDFEKARGYKPTLFELSRFGKIPLRLLINVLEPVSDSLELSIESNPLRDSLLDQLKWTSVIKSCEESDDGGVVHRILASMPPGDVAVLILIDLCGFDVPETRDVIDRCGQIWRETRSVDDVDAWLDEVTDQAGVSINCPWDERLVKEKGPGTGWLRVRLSRARHQFQERYLRATQS